jgi:cell wall-associated NlpC family hydrolase
VRLNGERLRARIARTAGHTGTRGRRSGWRSLLPAGIVVLAALGTLAGLLTVVLGGGGGGPQAVSAASGSPVSGVSGVSGVTGSAAPAAVMQVPAVRLTGAKPSPVAPLRGSVQADLLVVAPAALPASLLAKVKRLPGLVAAERIEAFRMQVNGTDTAVLGVDPSQFRSFAAHLTGASDPLWQGVADGGIAVSYTMGQEDKIALGGSVVAAGVTSKRVPVVAFGTLGIGGVNAVLSDATARSLGAPAGNAIVVSVRTADFTADSAAIGKLLPKGAGLEPLVSLINSGSAGTAVSDQAGAGSVTAPAAPATALGATLQAALSRKGLPYVYGASGPSSFDCSGLVQWSFAQAGIAMPRVAADQARTGPAVPVSSLQPGDLLFYHFDPTDPGYISHVAIYLGNGQMIQAPRPGENVEVVPADFGTGFAGAVRVSPAQAAAVARGIA